ncbi:MAG: hypothetical protein DWQ34_21025 [Planctomycetota bacterium]|nr:MAG: hypothetical protein DWQ34_21025 [Planctomycetota bacterium]
MSRIRQISVGRGLLACAAWWGASLLAPQHVHATCGDYLISAGDHHSAMEEMSDHPAEHSTPVPCHGPFCRSHDRIPMAPASSIKIVVPQWAVVLLRTSDRSLSVGPHLFEAGLLAPQCSVDPPRRPPRAV